MAEYKRYYVGTGFSLLVFIGILYFIYFISNKFHIPFIGTIAKWIMIFFVAIFGLFILIMLLFGLFAVVLFILALRAAKRAQNEVKKKQKESEIKILNPTVQKKSSSNSSSKASSKKKEKIIDAEFE
ncbi:MAG: hypothetical protein WC755_03110 [Candidatus Woesearchaeota archaeon]|jgi:membrane protein implicated in regulation of membrane protease activity